MWFSELLPHISSIADDLCVIKTLHTEAINHDPALTFFQTGAQVGNRPSMGSWLSYGLGSENKNLPAFCVLLSKGKGNGQGVYSKLWSNGFLDSIHQGVQFSSGENPVLYLNDPDAMTKSERRKLLDETLVIWGGEFGRTNYCQGTLTKENYGRDHHPRCFTIWMAGGGVKPGVYGETDDFGYNIARDPVHVHDFHATVLHLMGLDHEKLTFKNQGRRYRLTDVSGKVINGLIK